MSNEFLGLVTVEEIATQPDLWLRAADMPTSDRHGLPSPRERVLVLGCGTSYYVAEAYARLREQADQGLTDAIVASELTNHMREYDRVLAISRSGTTSDVLSALKLVPDGVPITAVLGELCTPIADAANQVIDLSFADERSVVQTRFPTTLLTLLRVHLGETRDAARGWAREVSDVIAVPPSEPMPRQFIVLATGWPIGLAQEAALKCRESAGMWAEAYAAGEYLHGPIAAADSDTLVWALTPLTNAQTSAVIATGARLRQATADPQVELVAIQWHAVAWAASIGRNADRPTHLTRSVVHQQ